MAANELTFAARRADLDQRMAAWREADPSLSEAERAERAILDAVTDIVEGK